MSDLLQLLQFIFRDFWTWLGFLVLVTSLIDGPLALILTMLQRRGGSIKASKDAVEIETESRP